MEYCKECHAQDVNFKVVDENQFECPECGKKNCRGFRSVQALHNCLADAVEYHEMPEMPEPPEPEAA